MRSHGSGLTGVAYTAPLERQVNVLSGLCGSGKTGILRELQRLGAEVLDLEALARHRGSAFGARTGHQQPTGHEFCAAISRCWTVCGAGPLWIEDEGPGLPPPANLFVPFFTTKPEGTGLGLVLARQIVEAHGGRLTLRDRSGGRGCRAAVTLPLT